MLNGTDWLGNVAFNGLSKSSGNSPDDGCAGNSLSSSLVGLLSCKCDEIERKEKKLKF